jgi:hypothetical protein
MTSPHGSGGEPSPDLAVYDLRPGSKASALPLAVGQLILAIGVATLLFGLWALASTANADTSTSASRAATQATDNTGDDTDADTGAGDQAGADDAGSGEQDDDADDTSDTSDSSDGIEARFDCNADGSVCRFTTPEQYETYFCTGSCALPDWLPDDALVLVLPPGDPTGVDCAGDGRGALVPLPDGHSETSYVRFGERNDGQIGFDVVGGTGTIPIRFGTLTAREGTRSAAPAAAQPDDEGQTAGEPDTTEDEVDEADPNNGVDEDAEPLLGQLAPLLILLGAGLIVVAVVALRKADNEPHALSADGDLDPNGQPPKHPADHTDQNTEDDAGDTVAAQRARKITDLIADLRADPDPARAIQRAYAALETGFGNAALARKPSETCTTYLHRTIGVVGGVSQPLRTLTTLFELARFSDATIDEQMRADAIEALALVRDAWRTRARRTAPSAAVDEPAHTP